MELSYLKAIGVEIPSGYTIANGAMTADSEHVYFAAAHGSAPKLLIFNMTGRRIETAEFSIHALPSSRSFDAVAIDAENLYLLSNSEALGVLADVFPYSKLGTAGRQFALEEIRDDLDSSFEAVKGAVFINDEIVVLMERSFEHPVDRKRLSVARFRPDGGYVENSFSVLALPADVDPRGMTLAGNRVYVLESRRLLALDRGFAYVSTENVAVEGQNRAPIGVGWNGSALLVYDENGNIYAYGAEQPSVDRVHPAGGRQLPPRRPPRQFRSRGLRKYVETLDVVKRNADGTLLRRGAGLRGLRQSTIEEVYVSDSADLTTLVNLFTIYLERPMPEIEIDDFVMEAQAGVDALPPGVDVLPPERYQVKGFGEWGDRYRQVLYCVRVRGDGEADALAGVHSPLRIRRR